MEKRHLELAPRARCRPRGRASAPASRSARTSPGTSCAAATTPSSSRPASTVPRDLPIPGRDLAGVHFAMEYLVAGRTRPSPATPASAQITAEGKHVVVIGGGDTGADCIGTAHRQGALSVTNLAIGKQPPAERRRAPAVADGRRPCSRCESRTRRAASAPSSPRPSSSSANEAGEVARSASPRPSTVDGRRAPKSGTEREIPADLVLIAHGLHGSRARPARRPAAAAVRRPGQRRARRRLRHRASPGVFVAGDAGRGQSLIVWAIAEGRAAAAGGRPLPRGETQLPGPGPADRSRHRALQPAVPAEGGSPSFTRHPTPKDTPHR